MQARKIKEYESRLRAIAAKLERELSSSAAMKCELDALADAWTLAIAEHDALLEERDLIAAGMGQAEDDKDAA